MIFDWFPSLQSQPVLLVDYYLSAKKVLFYDDIFFSSFCRKLLR
jgi:hypothetical protein